VTEISDRFHQLAEAFSATLSSVPADRWTAPSPNEGWSASDTVAHVVETQRDFLQRFDETRRHLVDEPSGDPVADWTQQRQAAEAVLNDPVAAGHRFDGHFGPTTVEATLDGFYGMDLLIHRWDVARAAKLADHEAMDEDLVAHYAPILNGLGDAARSPGVFGPAVEVGADASAQDRLLAFTGRTP
jgi:uncharacterized protein (TIGR03086 family)